MKRIAIALIAILPAISFADVKVDIKEIEVKTQACLDKEENQNTVGMKICVGEGYEAMDQLLNKVYNQIVNDLKKSTGDADSDKYSAEVLSRLVKSQRAWITFRDTNSDFHGTTMLNGTGEGLVVAGTATDMTKNRIIEIDDVVNGSL